MLWYVSIAGALVIGAAWLLPYRTGDTSIAYEVVAWVLFLVRSLGSHVGMVAVLIFVVALVRRQWLLALLVIVVAILLLAPLAHRPARTESRSGSDLSVFSANVLFSNEDFERTLEQIDELDPDVVLLQEYTLVWQRAIGRELAERYPYVQERSEEGLLGLAVFSRHRIVDARDVDADRHPEARPQMLVELDVDGRELVVVNAHPVTSITPGRAAIQRAQVARLERLAEREERPLLIAGDMNFTETSAPYEKLRGAGLVGAWDELGSGRGSTWHIRYLPDWFPGLRLDHIFTKGAVRVDRIQIEEQPGSDHDALFANVTFGADR